jgi:hypothetical protein
LPHLALAPLSGSAFLQVLLDLIPNIATDDCRMLPFVDCLFVPDATGIDRVGQQVVKCCAFEWDATSIRVA